MKHTTIILLLLTSVLAFQVADAQSFKAMTYNIRYDNPDDGEDNWHRRKGDMVRFIEQVRPLIFGIQEGLHHQVEYLDSNLVAFDYTGVGRDDGKQAGEFSAIFYQPDKVTLIDSGTFWLSSSPDQVSVGWDASMERICSYGLFQHLGTNERFWVFNTHFDHRGPEARLRSAELIVSQIKKINKGQLPVVLMGDFNATPDQAPIRVLQREFQDGVIFSKEKMKGPEGTNIGFQGDQPNRRIDYIFVSGLTINQLTHKNPKTGQGRNLSDHLPVIAEMELSR